MMQWMSEWLLSSKIEELSSKNILAGNEECLLLQYQKELEVLNALRIEGIDLRGGIETVKQRLKDNSIYFINKSEFELMRQKASLFDAIKKITN